MWNQQIFYRFSLLCMTQNSIRLITEPQCRSVTVEVTAISLSKQSNWLQPLNSLTHLRTKKYPGPFTFGMADRRKRSHIISYSPYELQRSAQKRVRKDDSNTTTTITTITTTEVTLPLNDLPIPISHPRPFRQLFVCGTGDFGQLGLGVTTENTHIDKPELHYFLDLVISINSKNGSKDPCEAAIEQVCSGGMHSLVVDELGHVSPNKIFCYFLIHILDFLIYTQDLVMGS